MSCNIVKDESEHIMLDEEGISRWLQDEDLQERLRGVIVSLQLPHHVHQDAPVKHWVAVNGGHDVRDTLESEGVDFLHDLEMPPSNIGWQSMEVTMCAILWKVRELIFSMILAVPCICCPSKLRKLCSALYNFASSPLEAGLSNIA